MELSALMPERPGRSQWRRVVFEPLFWMLRSIRNAMYEVDCELSRLRIGALVKPMNGLC